jgi:3-deoxy-D-manno-octulosonic-acid transferase
MPVAARFSDKLAAGMPAGQARWSVHLLATSRDRNRPLVWLHAASVGEGLQAAAVLERLRAWHSDWQYLYTHFSPSAEPLPGGCRWTWRTSPHDQPK